MIKRELAKDPAMAEENWDRFLPKFKKRNVPRRKPLVVREKKPYTPFPPPQQPSKVDLQLESGEYFLSEQAREAKRKAARDEQQRERGEAAKRRREDGFVAPKVGWGGGRGWWWGVGVQRSVPKVWGVPAFHPVDGTARILNNNADCQQHNTTTTTTGEEAQEGRRSSCRQAAAAGRRLGRQGAGRLPQVQGGAA